MRRHALACFGVTAIALTPPAQDAEPAPPPSVEPLLGLITELAANPTLDAVGGFDATLSVLPIASLFESHADRIKEVVVRLRSRLDEKRQAIFDHGTTLVYARAGRCPEPRAALLAHLRQVSATPDRIGPNARQRFAYTGLLMAQTLSLDGETADALVAARATTDLLEGLEAPQAVSLRCNAHEIAALCEARQGLNDLARRSMLRMWQDQPQADATALQAAQQLTAMLLLQMPDARLAPDVVAALRTTAPALADLTEAFQLLRDAFVLNDTEGFDAAAATFRSARAGGLDPTNDLRARVALARCLMSRPEDPDLDTARSLLDEVTGQRDALDLPLALDLAAYRARWLRAAADGGREVSADALLDAAEQLGRELERFRDDAARQPIRAGGLGVLSRREPKTALSEWVALRHHLTPDQAPEQAWQMLLSYQALLSRPRALGLPVTSLAEVRRTLLGPGDAVVALLVAQHQTHVLAFDGNDAWLWPRAAGFDALELDAFREQLKNDPRQLDPESRQILGDALMQSAKQAGEDLLSPELERLLRRWDTVLLCDQGMLRGVEFECLMLRDRALVGETAAVTVVPSLAYACRQLRDGPTATESATVDVRIARELVPAVPPTLAASWARAGLEGHPTRQLNARGLRGAAFRADITQVLAHGERQAQRERSSGLRLDGGQFFGARELEQIERARGLVILSVCGLAQAAPRVGDGVDQGTFAGILHEKGAHTVLQSRAVLGLESHARLLGALFDQLALGANTATALRDARAARRNDGADAWERFTHARVRVFGLGHRAPLRPRIATPWRWPWLGVAALGLAIAAAAAWRVLRNRSSAGPHRGSAGSPG